MAKRKNKRNKRTAAAAAKPANKSADSALIKIEKAATANANESDHATARPTPPPPVGATPEDMIKRASDALALLEAQRKRLEKVESDATKRAAVTEKRASELNDERDKLKAQREEFAQLELALTEREEELSSKEAEVLARHEEIAKRELDADAGFSRRNREALAQLEAEGEALREQFSNHRKRIEDERAEFEQEIRERRDAEAEAATERGEVEATQLAALRSEGEEKRAALEVEAKRLRKLARRLEVDKELLAEDREAVDEKVQQLSARILEQKDGEIEELGERLEVAQEERNRLARVLAEREEADRRFGGETPDEVMKRLRALEEKRAELQRKLGERPSAEASQRLADLERQKELWESDRLALRGELEEARQEASRKRIAVTGLESVRDEKRSLESANALLRQTSEQLRTEVDALITGVEGKSPFPSCNAMDSNSALQANHRTTDTIENLTDFAERVRHRMARDPQTGKELYYSAEDVRSFIGGLAMSRLHLLQGISGTGKTSLPLAFARAIGAGDTLIEVQAGWRDRQDLIGHFNTFERRFYESEFLQAMYRASTPAFADKPFIIVLDEMNLSHPEQYFADLLSALEQDKDKQRLVLMSAAVEPAPRLLKEGGTKMLIPPNVWFVGTANHDETTKDFADKTYDRAHVMELPRNVATFEPKHVPPEQPVSVAALENGFGAAVYDHKNEAKAAYEFLQSELGDALERKFRVGWGNRLERQMRSYVPVVIAAGGTVGEATDHILATKLLRKIRDRHDNRPEDIVALREQIQTGWATLNDNSTPRRSLALIKQELHRLGHDDE